ncbi:MAG: hypothetical protein D6719_00320 [Candidatus Dadabacteria bacterium]|nr:MAG: hypothetical protein D6719_00320 [Candidatus Dadabacteria bacterium]
MGKVKKFAAVNIRKITGGKDPVRLVEEFILRRGFDPDECQKEKNPDSIRWMLSLGGDEELEVLLEGLKRPQETTIYMGVNVAAVPLRSSHDFLVAALEIADGLVGIKVSLVGHYLVLSATLGAAGISVEDLDYHYRLITAQQSWFREALAEELGWAELPIA